MLNLAEHPGFAAFHRVLNRNAWSSLALAHTLLRMVVAAFVPAGPIVIGVDHTLERHRGRHIGLAGHFYDAGRSSAEWQATSRGLRWLSAMVLVEMPFAGHVWALPVLTALTPSRAWSERHGRRHRPVTDWAPAAAGAAAPAARADDRRRDGMASVPPWNSCTSCGPAWW